MRLLFRFRLVLFYIRSMNIIIDNINTDLIYFNKPIPNKIIHNSNFIRLGYSNHLMNLNSICIQVHLFGLSSSLFSNKIKCILNNPQNIITLQNLITLEKKILSLYSSKKKAIFDIHDKLIHKINFAVSHYKSQHFANKFTQLPANKTFILNISGIWEDYNSFGLTFKFID